MNKTLNNDNSKPPRRIDTAGCRSSLTDGSTINKEEARRNRKERQDGLSRRVLSTLCPCWTALATVRPGHATELMFSFGFGLRVENCIIFQPCVFSSVWWLPFAAYGLLRNRGWPPSLSP